jgi:hypothetical protein
LLILIAGKWHVAMNFLNNMLHQRQRKKCATWRHSEKDKKGKNCNDNLL